MKILIVGGGIGGLTLAAFLEGSNIDYEIVEKSPDWEKQGYALGLWNNGRNIFKKLGLAENFDASGKSVRNYYVYDGKGKLLRKYNFSDFFSDYGLALKLVKRTDVHNWLLSKINPGKVAMGININSIIQNAENVEVEFSNGERKKYDLVVGADGIHSRVRDLVFAQHVESKSHWRVWWMWVDNKFNKEASVSEYLAPREFISLFDSGDKTLAIIAAPQNHEIWDEPKNRIERLKVLFKNETALVPEIFSSLKAEEIMPSDLTHVNLNKWVKGRVVLLGDSAHGFEPHGGIGGSMALEDGYVLAGELMKVSKNYTLESALSNYETKRKKRVEIARKVTNKMKGWVLVKSGILRYLINLFVPYFPEKYLLSDYRKLLQEEI